MRSTFAVLILATAACGGSDNKTPDASSHADAPKPIDAAADAAPDSPPDGMGSGSGSATASRVWAVGDFVTNNTLQAGWFTDGDALPATPTTIPAAPAVLASGTGYTSLVFDATATKTAYVADVTTAGTFDLYVANADGSNPTLLVPGAANVEIASIALSPDGTKVAYTMDSATYNNAYDVWVVNTTGTPVPLLVSPTRPLTAPAPANLSAFTGSLTWSSDSKWVAFSGDFTTDGHSQAYEVDTTAATPMAVAMLADTDLSGTNSGVRGAILFDANDKAYFRAGLTDNVTFTFFQWDGNQKTTLALPPRGDNSTPNVGSFAISPDGTTIVFAADAPTATAYDLYATPIALWSPVKLTNATLANTNPPFGVVPQFSPDGTKVAFLADYITDGDTEPFVAKIDGTDTHRLYDVTVMSADAEQIFWTADGSAVYVQGDLETNNDSTLFRLDPTMTDGTATKAITVPASGDVFNTLIRAE
jgi:Tol biopolymer transport system component